MVEKTRELLPEPETPVKAVSRRFGSSTLTSLRLFSRAPWTRRRSWLSAACAAADRRSVLVAMRRVSRPRPDSANLIDADQVARGVADGAVADAVRLVDRLLDDL